MDAQMDIDQMEIDLSYCGELYKSVKKLYEMQELCDVILIASLNDQK